MAIDIGRIAYEQYIRQLCISEKCDCIRWEELGKSKQDAWRHAAVAVLAHIEEERKYSNIE